MPELGLISRDRAEEGTVNVTDDADTEGLYNILMNRLPNIVSNIAKTKPGRRANGRSEKPLALRPCLCWLVDLIL